MSQELILAVKTKIVTLTNIPVYDTWVGQNRALPFIAMTVVSDTYDYYFAVDDRKFVFQLDLFTRLENGTKECRDTSDMLVAGLHRSAISNTTNFSGLQIICINPGNNPQKVNMTSGLSQQDQWRIRTEYKLFASGN